MKTYCTDGSGFSVLLNAIMSSFPSVHVSAFAEAYPNLIREVLICIQILFLCFSSFATLFTTQWSFSTCNAPRHPQTTDEIVPRSQLFASLGVVCCDSSPAADKILPILNDVWKSVSRVEDCVA